MFLHNHFTRRQAMLKKKKYFINEPLWYKDAVIYELNIKAFYDSNADGIGDFKGLTKKLDYLDDLGITAIWLLPFYPSPLRDDGYDISDYCSIHPNYGTLKNFKEFLNDDLDTPGALAQIWAAVKEKTVSLSTLHKFDKVLGLKIEEGICISG